MITKDDATGSEAAVVVARRGRGNDRCGSLPRFRGLLRHIHDRQPERAVLQGFDTTRSRGVLGPSALNAGILIVAFVSGVTTAMYLRRRLWKNHPHGATVLTSLGLLIAGMTDLILNGFDGNDVTYVPIVIVAFSVGALNAAFVKNGEVSIPLSYVTGTLVKLGVLAGDVVDSEAFDG